MTKVLFLDVDGCINDHSKHSGSVYCGILPRCMAELNRVIAATGCKLVISSAWRYLMLGDKPSMSQAGFEYMLATHGLLLMEGEHLVIGHTEADLTVWGIEQRGWQIRQWLETEGRRLEVEQWAVVDDLPVPLPPDDQWRLVQTDGTRGMTAVDADRLIEILGGIAP